MTAKMDGQKNNDMMLKVIAVICAILLWFYAEAQENPSGSRQLAVPVQYVNLASSYVVENEMQSVQITIKGKEADIMSLRSDDFVATVDLSNAKIGSDTYSVRVSAANISERFSYTPDKVTLSIDQIQQKEVAVRVRTTGELPQYYELTSTEVLPDTVVIRGKSKVLADISDVETEAIELNSIMKDTVQQTVLQLPAGVTAQVADADFTTDAQVAVTLQVQPVQTSKIYETPIAVCNVPEGLTAVLEQRTAKMTMQGSAVQINTQPILDIITLHVDCTGLTVGQHILPIQVEQANEITDVELKAVEPQTITVMLEAEDGSNPVHNDISENESDAGINETGEIKTELDSINEEDVN